MVDYAEELVQIVQLPEWKSILLEIVRRENFDPWDIDVGALAERYVEYIRNMRENNLTVPANALLACAILLNLKAERLEELYREREEVVDNVVIAEPEEPEPLPREEPLAQEVQVIVPQRVQPRRITLDELLSTMEKLMIARKKRNTVAQIPDAEEFFENVDRAEVELLIEETYEKIIKSVDSEGITTLSRIVRNTEELIPTLLAVLYLANERRINVWQEKPFAEVFIAVREHGGEEDH